jgi:hypothetical protein
VRTSHRYQVRAGEPLASELKSFAAANGLSACAAIRLLAREALDARQSRTSGDSPAAVAALVVAEQSLLAIATVLPDGERRIGELAERATAAAEARLALFSSEER